MLSIWTALHLCSKPPMAPDAGVTQSQLLSWHSGPPRPSATYLRSPTPHSSPTRALGSRQRRHPRAPLLLLPVWCPAAGALRLHSPLLARSRPPSFLAHLTCQILNKAFQTDRRPRLLPTHNTGFYHPDGRAAFHSEPQLRKSLFNETVNSLRAGITAN